MQGRGYGDAMAQAAVRSPGAGSRRGPWSLVRGLALACHPGPTVVVTVLATALAAAVGAGAWTTTVLAVAVLTGQLSVGWSNDWLDAGRDQAVERAAKPVVAGLVSAVTLRRAAWWALAVCAVASLVTGLVAGAVHLVAVAFAWGYNLGLKSTAWSWLPYAVSFALLAEFAVLAAPGDRMAPPWLLAAAALLGVGAHVANTLPDLDDDAATGVRGLPHRLGRRTSGVLAPTLLVTAVAFVVAGPSGPPSDVAWVGGSLAAALATTAGAVALTRPASRAPFSLSMAVAVVCLVMLAMNVSDVAIAR